MRQKCLMGMIALVLGTSAAHAGYVEVAVNEETADLRGGFHIGKSPDMQFHLGGRYLYHDFDEGDLEGADDARIPAVLAGFVSRPSPKEDVAFTVGVQLYYGEAADQDVQGLGLGTSIGVNPGGWKGFYLGGRFYWAGSAFSFGDTEEIFEWGGQVGYAFNEMFRVFVEYSSLEVDTEDFDDIEVVEDVTVGFNFNF